MVWIAAAALVLAAALRLGLGARWFSFYGVAAVALVVVPPLAWTALARLKAAGRRRWPAVLLTLVTLLAAAVQIGFWLAFFHGGTLGLGIGVGRSMVLAWIERLAPWLAGGLALAWTLLLAVLPSVSSRITKAPSSERS